MMASHVVIIDSTFRRVTVKVNPGTYLTDVLEEACTKLKLKSSNYGFKNNNKAVDLSRTFRQTGLSSGAKLEIVAISRTPSAVSVALQLPPGIDSGRLTDKFPSDTTFWRILRKFETTGRNGAPLNFTGRGAPQMQAGGSGAGRIFYEMPVLNIMGRDLSTLGDLQKTLAQLGFNSGSAMIRLSFKLTEQPLEEATAEIVQYFKEDSEEEATKASGGEGAGDSQQADTVTDAIARLPSPEKDSAGDTEMTTFEPAVANSHSATPAQATEPSEPGTLGPGQRPIEVYSAPSNDTPKAALTPHNENDYEPSIAHAKLHQSRLLNSSVNKRLPSDAELEQAEKEKAAKLSNTKEVKIKIRFPDQSSTVSTFDSQDSGNVLYTYVTGLIDADDQPFKLVSPGPVTVPRSEAKLIKDLGWSGGILVNFIWEDGASDKATQNPALKQQYRQTAKEIPVPQAPVGTVDEETHSKIDKGKGKETDSREGKPKGMPKWLKLPGKK